MTAAGPRPAVDAVPWWSREDGISFTWDLWYACNYRCSYCWWEMDHLWETLAKQNHVLAPEHWVKIWQRMHDLYGPVCLDMIGGEPLLYPRIEELLESLSKMHRLRITTNLSMETNRFFNLIGRLSPERAHMNASFHPQFADSKSFLEKIRMLRAEGFAPSVLIVTWPPFLSDLARYRDEFEKDGTSVTLMIFQGTWQGKTYPEAYTAEEKKLIAAMMPDSSQKEPEIKYRLDRQQTLGKLCHSGRVYANIKGNGDVYRCGQDAFGHKPMGNIFDENFRLFDEPKPCPYGQCSCMEFKFLDEVMASGAR